MSISIILYCRLPVVHFAMGNIKSKPSAATTLKVPTDTVPLAQAQTLVHTAIRSIESDDPKAAIPKLDQALCLLSHTIRSLNTPSMIKMTLDDLVENFE